MYIYIYIYWKGLTACAADPNNDALNEFFHDFLLPFGSLLAPFGRLGRPFLDSGTTPGPFRARGAKRFENGHNLVELWWSPVSPIWDNFGKVDDLLAASFLVFFWTPILPTICCSGFRLGSNLWCFLGYLGPLEIGLERWRGYDFHTLGFLFGGTNSKLDREVVFFVDCNDFCYFLDPFRGLFWDENVKKWDTEKRQKKELWKFPRPDPGNSVSGPCGPLKETKDPQILRDFARRGSLKAVSGKATQFSH